MKTALIFLLFAILTVPAYGQHATVEPIPKSAVFNEKNLQQGDQDLAGRLTLRRQFLGTRSTPAFKDIVQFNFFDGKELRFLTFRDAKLEKEMKQKLLSSYSLPVNLRAELEEQTVGHDGMNRSKRIVGKIYDCQVHTVEAMCEAAKSAGSSDAQVEQFKTDLVPEAKIGGVMANMSQVFARTEASRRGPGLSIAGIEIFNSNKKPAKIEIKKLWSEQNGDKQQYKMNYRSGPNTWEVAGQSWSDGVYEAGKSPKKIWNFDTDQPIVPKLKVTVHLELQINGEAVTLNRIVEPK